MSDGDKVLIVTCGGIIGRHLNRMGYNTKDELGSESPLDFGIKHYKNPFSRKRNKSDRKRNKTDRWR